MITIDSEKIPILGHIGTWHVIDRLADHRGTFFLLEHDRYGDEAASLIVLADGSLVLDDVYNGFSDLDDMPEENIARIRVSSVLRDLASRGCLFLWSESNKSVVFPVEALRVLNESELSVAEELLINQGSADHKKHVLSLARAVDEYYMNRDQHGYADSFDDMKAFGDVELRVARMKEYLEDPNGLSQTIESLHSDMSDMDSQELSDAATLNDRLIQQRCYIHEHAADHVPPLKKADVSSCSRSSDGDERER